MIFPSKYGRATILIATCFGFLQPTTAAAKQRVWNAKVVIVNNTPYNFDAAGVVHRPSRSVKHQWVDPVVDPKDPNKGVWKSINKGTQSTAKPIKFVTDNPIKERNWWFVVIAFKDLKGTDRLYVVDPVNFQDKLEIVSKASLAAVQTVGAKEVATLFAATGPGALAAAAIAGVLKILIDPAKVKSRDGYKEKSLHEGDANGTVRLEIREVKGELRLRIVTPTGATSGGTGFNEEVGDLSDIYSKMAEIAKVKEKDTK